jgi:F1F0 ATPase subunit 2
MNEALTLGLAGLGGIGLGAIFFGGLWWTVRRGVPSRRPALWLIGSLLLRMGVALGGFYLVAGGHWQRLVACLLGFVAARLVLTRLARPPQHIRPGAAQGGTHAS